MKLNDKQIKRINRCSKKFKLFNKIEEKHISVIVVTMIVGILCLMLLDFKTDTNFLSSNNIINFIVYMGVAICYISLTYIAINYVRSEIIKKRIAKIKDEYPVRLCVKDDIHYELKLLDFNDNICNTVFLKGPDYGKTIVIIEITYYHNFELVRCKKINRKVCEIIFEDK